MKGGMKMQYKNLLIDIYGGTKYDSRRIMEGVLLQ